MMRLQLGISTCPNDTFAFHAILNRKIDLQGLDFDIQLLDVQQLNELLAKGALDYSKASFHAALRLNETYGVMQVGAALGIGVGPIILSKGEKTLRKNSRILCPGEWTTATLLYKCLHPDTGIVSNVVFSEIMPALKNGDADFGVVIHEGRFTFQDEGLTLVEDLGHSWETLTGSVTPLGGILGRLSIPAEVHATFASVLRASIAYARANCDEVFQTMKKYALELDADVIWNHVELYVNQHTLDLGETGKSALSEMQALATVAGIVAPGAKPLVYLG